MASKDLLKSNPVKDLEKKLNADFNKVIKATHKSLSTKTHSPVWTGFFASSWKVQKSRVKARDDVMKYNPWAKIKQASNKTGRTRPSNPKVDARFSVKGIYNIKQSVFIGNRAKYASYALEGGKLQNFIQSRLAKIIKDNMKEKSGKLYLYGKTTGGFGSVDRYKGSGYGDVL